MTCRDRARRSSRAGSAGIDSAVAKDPTPLADDPSSIALDALPGALAVEIERNAALSSLTLSGAMTSAAIVKITENPTLVSIAAPTLIALDTTTRV